MQLLHTPAALSASFDEPNLLVSAGLVPAVRLAEKVGLPDLAAEYLSVPGPAGPTRGQGDVAGGGDGRRGRQHR